MPCCGLQGDLHFPAVQEMLADELPCARFCEKQKTIRDALWSWEGDWPTRQGWVEFWLCCIQSFTSPGLFPLVCNEGIIIPPTSQEVVKI